MSVSYIIILVNILFIAFGCRLKDEKQINQVVKNLDISWELISNKISDEPQFEAKFVITNRGDQTLGSENWAIFFNQTPRNILKVSDPELLQMEQISGDFYRLKPQSLFQLAPGDSIQFTYQGNNWMIKEVDAPMGMYFVTYDDQGNELARIPVDREIKPFIRPDQVSRFTYEATNMPTAQALFKENAAIQQIAQSEIPQILPSPISLQYADGNLILDKNYAIYHDEELTTEATYLRDFLSKEQNLELSLTTIDSAASLIKLSLGEVNVIKNIGEAYHLAITDQEVSIIGDSPTGVFYGIQSFLHLFPIKSFRGNSEVIEIPEVIITDAPFFGYRGMHLDVSRHFMNKESVYKLLDVMAFYKMNKFHFHLTDDEGWRLEIQELPELTEIGAYRGHTLTDEMYLHPAYGSGPDPKNNEAGSGYYSRQDFIEIIQYAYDRHIEVIPEINMPGHARAAIKAMNYRHDQLLKQGKEEEALEYLLIDTADESEYLSAQHYTDNTVNVCKESVYRFFTTVLEDVIAMYEEANVPLNIIHSGGDEVPIGVWEASPLCNQFLAENDQYDRASQLQAYFVSRIKAIAEDKNLKMAGWEEVALNRNEEGLFEVNPQFNDGTVIPYVWNNLWGNQDLGYRLANADYPVVLCNVTNFYFDLAYNRDPQEPGLYWGGFVDTRKAFDMIPFDIFKSMKEDQFGRPLQAEVDFIAMERLQEDRKDNILGLQGQLWSETIRNADMLEYYYLPKMLGLAERAWVGQEWGNIENEKARKEAFESSWSQFTHTLGYRNLPRLDYLFDGYNWRVPPPGLKFEDGKLYANVAFPSLTIRYTTDGSEPDENAQVYSRPIMLQGEVKAKTFSATGRSSKTSELTIDQLN